MLNEALLVKTILKKMIKKGNLDLNLNTLEDSNKFINYFEKLNKKDKIIFLDFDFSNNFKKEFEMIDNEIKQKKKSLTNIKSPSLKFFYYHLNDVEMPINFVLKNLKLCFKFFQLNNDILEKLPLEAIIKGFKDVEFLNDNKSKLDLNTIVTKEEFLDFCFKAVEKNGYLLRFFSEEFQKEYPKIALLAVEQTGNAISYVCETVKNLEENDFGYNLCLKATIGTVSAMEHVPEKYKDSNLCEQSKAIQEKGHLHFVPFKERTADICLIALKAYIKSSKTFEKVTGLCVTKEGYKDKFLTEIPDLVLPELLENEMFLECLTEKELFNLKLRLNNDYE